MKFFSVTATVLSVFSGLVAAQWRPEFGTEPNPALDSTLGAITKPGLFEQVPVSKPYTIKWNPTAGVVLVNLVLYKGPGNNIIAHSLVGANLENSGSFVWTPAADFPNVTEGWGLRIIEQATGATQWSTQFGFLNANPIDEEDDDDVDETTTTTTVVVTTTASVTASRNATASTTTTTLLTSTRNSTATASASATDLASTTTVIDESASSTQTDPAIKTTDADSGARANVVSFGMGLVAVAVAGFALF